MLMNDKIVFDRYYCINFAQMKEMMVHYILQPRHIFIFVKAFIFMLVQSGVQLLNLVEPGNEQNSKQCFNSTHENCYLNTWFSFH